MCISHIVMYDDEGQGQTKAFKFTSFYFYFWQMYIIIVAKLRCGVSMNRMINEFCFTFVYVEHRLLITIFWTMASKNYKKGATKYG